MINIRYQIRVPASLEKTFAAYADPYALGKILPEITSVHRKAGSAALKARDVFELNFKMSGRDWKQELELLEYKPATAFKTRSSDTFAENLCAMKFEHVDGTTVASCEIEYTLTRPWLRAFEPLFAGLLARETVKRAYAVNEHLKPGQVSSVEVLTNQVWGASSTLVKWGLWLALACLAGVTLLLLLRS